MGARRTGGPIRLEMNCRLAMAKMAQPPMVVLIVAGVTGNPTTSRARSAVKVFVKADSFRRPSNSRATFFAANMEPSRYVFPYAMPTPLLSCSKHVRSDSLKETSNREFAKVVKTLVEWQNSRSGELLFLVARKDREESMQGTGYDWRNDVAKSPK